MALTPSDIKRDLDQVEADGTPFRQRQDVNSKVRYARWDGQSEDGKKHERNTGTQPFPFEGASDTRVRLAESIINNQVRQLKNSAKRSKLKVKGTEISDWEQASKSTVLLDWMINSQMSPYAQRETELAAQYRQEKGGYAMKIDWHQETGTETDELIMDELAQLALEDHEAAELQALILDGGLDDEAAQLLASINEQLTEKQALKAVRELRENGIATYDVPYLRINRPRWTALRIYRDFYFPTYVDDIQRSPWCAERAYYTESEIREMEVSEGWSESFIERVLQHKGLKSLDHWTTQDRNKFGRRFSFEETVEDQEDLFEIYHVYYKENDPNSDAIGVYTYSMSYFVEDDQSNEARILDYDHGLYPYVTGVREYTERGLIQSRGVGEICQTWQGEVKIQRDNASDRTSLDTIPPILVPASRSDTKIVFGAATQIPVRRPDEIQPLQLPDKTGNTELIIAQTMREVNAYFGQDPENPQANLVYTQDLIDDWLSEMKQVYEQTFALMQQFMPDVEVNIVTGGTLQGFDFSRQQIQGKYDLSIQFDARDLDGEMLKEKLEVISNVILPLDTEGTIQRSGLVSRLMQWVDPIGAEELVSSPQQVSARELEDEQEALGKIGSGVEPPLNPEGKNAQMRMQIIQDTIQSNPNLMQRYQQLL